MDYKKDITMATIKSYTDLEQSRKLAEILPLESADMCYIQDLLAFGKYGEYKPYIGNLIPAYGQDKIKCWSLAALLDVLPFHLIVNNQRYAFSMHKGLDKDGEIYMLRYNVFNTDVCLCLTDYYNSTVDACYEMILKLHELNLL